MDCSPPGSSVCAISQARILEWVTISSPGDLLDPRIESESPVFVDGFFTTEASGKPQCQIYQQLDCRVPIPKKGNAKECSNYRTIALISYTSIVMLKTLQARLQPSMNRELPDIPAGFRKGRGTGDQVANIHWIIKKAIEFQKNIDFCFIDYAKAFDCMNHHKLWKILQEM